MSRSLRDSAGDGDAQIHGFELNVWARQGCGEWEKKGTKKAEVEGTVKRLLSGACSSLCWTS